MLQITLPDHFVVAAFAPHLIMPRPRNPDRYYKRIASHGLEATIKERGNGRLYLTGTIEGERVRQSLDTKNPVIAETRARETLAAIQRRLLRVAVAPARRNSDATVGEVLDAWRKLKKSDYTAKAGRTIDSRATFIGTVWGLGTPIAHLDQDAVDKATKAVLRRDRVQSETTARHYLTDTSIIFNWAARKKVEGVPLLEENALAELRLPRRDKNGRTPIASHERFLSTLRFTRGLPAHQPGALGTALVIARYQGRRVNSIRQLQHDDVCLSVNATKKRLAQLGIPPGMAKYWRHGTIVWRADSDKEGKLSIVPLHPVTARALRYHKRRFKRQGFRGPWLFPSPVKSGRPLGANAFHGMLHRAEERARDAKVDVPDLDRGCWHPYRRLWRSERGRFSEKAVAILGGWKMPGNHWQPSMNGAYLLVPPQVLAEVVEASPACRRDGIGTAENLLWHYEGLETQW